MKPFTSFLFTITLAISPALTALCAEPGFTSDETRAIGMAATAPSDLKSTRHPTTMESQSRFRSDQDGWLDMSGFLDKSFGFIPLVIPITEPAIGYGAAAALAFIDKPLAKRDGFGRPNITAIGGMATENGTRGVMAGNLHHWMDDRLQTLVGVALASVNLDYYGIGDNALLERDPLGFNLEPLGGLVQAKYRIGDSFYWAGLRYTLANTQVTFDAPAFAPGMPTFQQETVIGGLTPSLTYDSRDNLFTPTSGTLVEASAGLFSPAFGGDSEFQRYDLTIIHYVPLHKKLTLGIRGQGAMATGDAPFYMEPFITLRQPR